MAERISSVRTWTIAALGCWIRLGFLFDDAHARAVALQFAGERQPDRPGADDEHVRHFR